MKRIVWLLALSLISVTTVTFGDEVVFKNGEKLIGEVVSLTGGKLVFKSTAAGKVTVDIANVKSFHTDKPIKMQFTDGTLLESTVKADKNGALSIAGNATVKPQTSGTRKSTQIVLTRRTAHSTGRRRCVWTWTSEPTWVKS